MIIRRMEHRIQSIQFRSEADLLWTAPGVVSLVIFAFSNRAVTLFSPGFRLHFCLRTGLRSHFE